MDVWIVGVSFSALLGAVIGSFLNVCIYRIPLKKSIVSPPSACPRCHTSIRWYQNLPVISYALLAGKCGTCRVPISVRYPFVELLTAVLFAVVFLRFGFMAAAPVYMLFVASLIVITFIDLDHQIIPDVISLPGIVVGFCASFMVPWVGWVDSLIGILVGGGSLLLIACGYEFLTKKEGMGGGDIKLLAMIGGFLGWQAVFPVILYASFAGTLIGIPLMLLKKTDGKLALPFGPFLSLAAVLHLLFGRQILNWYLSLF